MSKPTVYHLVLFKHVLIYVIGTLDCGLRFCKSEAGLKLTGYCDSDWGSAEDCHSITGHYFILSTHGPFISWKCKKQRVVALSTCEEEYVAISHAVQECNFLAQLYADVTGYQRDTMMLFVDNHGALELTKNPVYHQRSQHTSIRQFYKLNTK